MKLFYFIFILNFLFIGFTCAQSNVVLNWVDTSNTETGFGIERALNSGNFSYLNGVSTNVQTYTDSSVQNSNTYYYRIYAWNSYGNSSYSNSINVFINSQGQGVFSSGSGGGSSSSSGVSGSSSNSRGLTASVIPNQNNESASQNSGENSITGNSVNFNNEKINNPKTIAGRVVDGDLNSLIELTELSPLAVYSILGLLVGIVFFIVVWKKIN